MREASPVQVLLSLFTAPDRAESIAGDLTEDDPVVRQNVETLYKLARERFRRHAEWFESFAERGRVSEILGLHRSFITNAGEVLREIDDFVSSLP
jgi:hypothetical protein